MLEFIEISKTFKSDLFKKPFEALNSVTFKVEEGNTIGFLGANGAGKTTSLKVLMDFIRPTTGRVNFSKELGRNTKEIFQNIGYLPERPFFYPHLTGKEFCHYMGSLANLKKSEINDQVKRWAPKFNIDHALQRSIRGYSKGMLQRLGFLVTLLHNPKLIILDEPLSGLDPIGRKELKNIIKEIHNEGKTVFFSSHIVSDLEEICSNVIFLEQGRVLYDGSVEKIIQENIEHKYTYTTEVNGVINRGELLEQDKTQFLENCLRNSINLINLEQNKPTLEEIFYKVKSL